MYTTRFKFLLVPPAYSLAFCLLFFGVVNGSASQIVRQWAIFYHVGTYSTTLYSWFLDGSNPSIYECFPQLASLQRYNGLQGTYYFPYGYQVTSSSSPNFTPYYYVDTGQFSAITVPDSVTSEFVSEINQYYQSLPSKYQSAVSGLTIAEKQNSDGSSELIPYFNHRNIGSVYAGGVIAYDNDGTPMLSSPDNNGYVSGYQLQPDGSYTPVYYTIENNQAIEHDNLPVTDYSSLSYDSDLSHYTLDIPNYSRQLDSIINKIDAIKFDGSINPEITVNPTVTIPPPEITVNPTVTISPPDVTVNPTVTIPPPDVTVNPTVTIPPPDVTVNVESSDLTDIEQSLVEIGNTLVADDHSLLLSTNDLSLTIQEQSTLNSLRQWETDIPLFGQAVDFGLNTLLGKIPNVGTEYLWMDYTIGVSKRNTKASSNNPLDGYHIRIDLTSYRETLLAIRGWLILLEALYFLLLIYRNIREALNV